jgi:Cu(I)/Ag(I) efflux system membrane fusion protein
MEVFIMSENKKVVIMILLSFFIVFLVGNIFFVSCNKNVNKRISKEQMVRNVRNEEVGKEVVCPVTKNKFKVTPQTKAIEYEGETYYFCCSGCDSQFIKEPEKYINDETHNLHSKKQESQTEGIEILYWTCSMHPQVKQNKPGKCPICGMELIPVYKGEEDKIVIDEKTVATVGIKSQPAKRILITKTIRLPAKVAYDNDLYLAQQEYLSSFYNLQKINSSDTSDVVNEEQKNRMKETLEAAKFRLSLLGYTDDEIEKLQLFKEPDKNLIYPGDKVWMYAEVYENDLAMVKPGQNVTAVTPAYPSEKFTGIVRFIEPVLNPKTRSAKARIVFDNPEGKLKLEMYADLEIKISLGKHLSIPETALIDTGTRKIVYLDLGKGRYKMQEVKTGFEADGYVQILSGLKEGDLVVTDGNFMLDSQSTLSGGQSLLYGSAEEVKEKKPKSVTGPTKGEGGGHKH